MQGAVRSMVERKENHRGLVNGKSLTFTIVFIIGAVDRNDFVGGLKTPRPFGFAAGGLAFRPAGFQVPGVGYREPWTSMHRMMAPWASPRLYRKA